ncbi:MAG: SGNH/GDSL hydrolase family protein [Pseudonocardia sp.]|nr:SGNH/GDSL hydrolase family protein [Pseudonocardia sp.]
MLRFLLPVLACALLLVGLAPAASAADTAGAPVDYVALGDSYAAGVGATPDGRSGDCRRSAKSYPARWAAANDPATFVSVACSRATTGQVLLKQVRTVSRQTDLVTITVGGNDTGFAPVLGVCSTTRDDADCDRAVRGGERVARYVLPVGLTAIIAAVKVQSPHAKIVVLGYPRLYAPGAACDVPLVPNATRRAALNRAADTLNASLRGTATRFGARFADVSRAFSAHGVCSADPWINGPTAPHATGNYHPTSVGYARGYLPALQSAAPRA